MVERASRDKLAILIADKLLWFIRWIPRRLRERESPSVPDRRWLIAEDKLRAAAVRYPAFIAGLRVPSVG